MNKKQSSSPPAKHSYENKLCFVSFEKFQQKIALIIFARVVVVVVVVAVVVVVVVVGDTKKSPTK